VKLKSLTSFYFLLHHPLSLLLLLSLSLSSPALWVAQKHSPFFFFASHLLSLTERLTFLFFLICRLSWAGPIMGPTPTVRSYYIAIKEGASITCCFASIWKLNPPARVAVFKWLLLKNKLFAVDNLIRRGWFIVNMCHLCRQQGESAKHMFQQCQYIKEVL
jgi:zinc-binding in reverse transcriptase